MFLFMAIQENADIYMGRILLCGALIRSKLLLECKSEEQQKIFGILFSAGQQRSYLSFISVSFLVDFLEQSDTKSLKSGIWPLLKKEVGKAWENQTLDTFYILLIMNEKFPTLVGGKFLKEHLGHEDIINGEHMKELLKLLTVSILSRKNSFARSDTFFFTQSLKFYIKSKEILRFLLFLCEKMNFKINWTKIIID